MTEDQQFEQWVLEGQQLAKRLHQELAVDFLDQHIRSRQSILGPMVAGLAYAFETGNRIVHFASLPFDDRLAIVKAGIMGLMQVHIDIQTRMVEKLRQVTARAEAHGGGPQSGVDVL